ncbi:class I SAM-dependent methyltransferase [Luteibacter sp. 22Crub2.1]|uniref:class I SAM-dependent methyltransferase n=2 Tax=Rhodanobacteraceae TaxID=1775411 RepID=UPI0020CA36DA|nr:class I SAM-dependent methyltransferase [Luteibacter sp. 22Crub2.1]
MKEAPDKFMQSQTTENSQGPGDRVERVCPVCGSPSASARRFLDERIDPSRLNEYSFASRKEPEFFNYRMVQCVTCDVVFVDRPPSQQALHQAYHVAEYDSSEEAEDAAAAYLRELEPILQRIDLGAALEIGTGTGILLEGLATRGFSQVAGVEPSTAAIKAAPAHRRPWIREGIFQEDDYQPESFDLICCFMTLEHVKEPREIAESVHRLLKPGGAFVTVTHDYRSAVNRLLGRRSPIIDVEHMQLFSPQSIVELFQRSGYQQVVARPFANRYALSYWVRLMPLGATLKRVTSRLLASLGLASNKVSINVGNMVAVGYRQVDAVRHDS